MKSLNIESIKRSSFYLYLVFIGISAGVLRPILPLYFRDIGLSIVEWSLLASIAAVGLTVSEVVWGVLSDRVGRKIILVLAPLGLSFIIPSYTLTVILPMFFVLQFLRGSIFSAVLPTSKAYVSDTASAKRLGGAMGLWIASINSGRIVGLILGPFLANNWSYSSSFYLSAISVLIGSVLAFTMLNEPKPSKATNLLPLKLIVQKLFKSKNVLILLIVGVVQVMGDMLVLVYLPIFAVELFGASTVEVGWLLAVHTGSLILTTFLSGPLSDRIGKKFGILIGFILLIFSSTSYLLIDNIIFIFLPTIGMAAGIAFIAPSILALLTDLVGSEVYGSVMGMYGTFEDLGGAIAPLLYGFVWSLYGPVSIFYTCAFTQIGGIALILLLKTNRKVN